METKKYVIVGGVAGGVSAAARLRRKDENAEIIVLEKGPFVSFSNCGLPYRLSGEIKETEDLILMTPEGLKKKLNLDVRVNNFVYDIDTENKVVKVKNNEDGTELEDISYDSLVLSPGAAAFTPAFIKESGIPNFELKTVPDTAKIIDFLEEQPRHITVMGGGFIGIEAAENLKMAGYQVTLIEGGDQLMAPLDLEMSLYADSALLSNGVKVIKGKMVEDVVDGQLLLDDGTMIATDAIIVAIGVRPNTQFLSETNIELDEQGFIKVNDNYETNIADVYAIGDAIKVKHGITGEKVSLALAGPANKQGRLVADRIKGEEIVNKGYIGSSIIKIFDTSIASTGLNEKQLANLDIDYEVAFLAPAGIVSIMPNVTFIRTKLIFEKPTGRVLGAQAVGEYGVDKRIDVIATAIKFGATVEDLQDLELTYAPPFGTGKDVVNKAGYVANNLLKGDFEQVRFTDVYDLLEKGAQIIDVREQGERDSIHFEGTKFIPATQMRERLDEIDKSQPVYLHCKTGERSYNATLMLRAKGYEAYNIAGSMLFGGHYEKVMKYHNPTRKDILVK